MKKCLTTLYDNNFSIFMDKVIPTFEQFCTINEFELVLFPYIIDNSKHPSWNKLLAIQECFNNYELVMWADADSIFLDRPDLFLEHNEFTPEVSLMLNHDSNGICMSHFCIMNTDYNKQLLETLWFLGDVIDDNKFGRGIKWEQNALKALISNFKIPYKLFKQHTVVDYIYHRRKYEHTYFYHFSEMAIEDRKHHIYNLTVPT